MNECSQAQAELLVWQLLFSAMAVIALVLAFLAYPGRREMRRILLMWKRRIF